jgi:hypothetical protein
MAYRAFLMAQTHHPISAPAVAEWIKDMPRYFNSIEGLSTHRGMLVFEELAHRAITDGTLDATRALHPRMKQIVREELFEGNRSLFEGLYADQHWDWSVTHPVVHLSFGAGVLKTPEDLAASLHEQVSALEKAHGLPAEMPDIRSRFKRVLQGLHDKAGRRVVVLVDEYDKPILDNLTEPDRARAMREALRDLYSVLKDADAHLRFVFITGVSKFSKVSLFSGLNNLNDMYILAASRRDWRPKISHGGSSGGKHTWLQFAAAGTPTKRRLRTLPQSPAAIPATGNRWMRLPKISASVWSTITTG